MIKVVARLLTMLLDSILGYEHHDCADCRFARNHPRLGVNHAPGYPAPNPAPLPPRHSL